MRKTYFWAVAMLVIGVVGCDSSGTIASTGRTTADVKVVNASTVAIDLLQDQSVDLGNGDLAFGAGSLCLTVDIISHGLSVRPAGLHTTNSVLPSFSASEKYLVVVTGNSSSLQPVSFRNSFSPTVGKAALRLINVSGSGPYDVFVTAPAAVLVAPSASNVGSGSASAYFDVPTTTQQVRLTTTGSTLVAFDAGNVTLTAGTRAVVLLAPPAVGSTTARTFLLQLPPTGGC